MVGVGLGVATTIGTIIWRRRRAEEQEEEQAPPT
jgi:hypothetical protein